MKTMVRVVFVAPKSMERMSATTLLRSHQLRKLTLPLFDAAGIESSVSHRTGFRDSILVLNKNILEKTKPHSLERMKRRGNVLVADPADGRIDDNRLALCDVLVAMSFLQCEDLSRRFAKHRVAYVGMHVDLRIGDVAPPQDRLRLAHFGEITNAKFAGELVESISFVGIDTGAAAAASWIAALSQHNAHYLVRSRHPKDGFKPFIKGIIAAHCGCPILVDTGEDEARRFLPPDYPYFTGAASVDSVRETIGRMRQDFGGAEWRRALTIMGEVAAENSRDRVAHQFFDAISGSLANLNNRPPPRPSWARRIAERVGRL